VRLPVSVDLPLAIGIPVDYIADQNLRLKLYRRLADMEREAELDALEEEFLDRFGLLPETVQNLFYQMRVKLRAQEAGLAAVAFEGDQIVLRYPPLPEGITERNLPTIAKDIRSGRNAYWMMGGSNGGQDWRDRLLEALSEIIQLCQPSC
jgi:transcription-repair coupling factor (superfamily II helicase)